MKIIVGIHSIRFEESDLRWYTGAAIIDFFHFLLFSLFFADKCGSLDSLPVAQSGVFELCLAFIRLVLHRRARSFIQQRTKAAAVVTHASVFTTTSRRDVFFDSSLWLAFMPHYISIMSMYHFC